MQAITNNEMQAMLKMGSPSAFLYELFTVEPIQCEYNYESDTIPIVFDGYTTGSSECSSPEKHNREN